MSFRSGMRERGSGGEYLADGERFSEVGRRREVSFDRVKKRLSKNETQE